jgi:L-glyceraldehyde 3-phosphate reductase
MSFTASTVRYDAMKYARCGRSGLMLPRISLGLWHNFGDVDRYAVGRDVVLRAFDLGITHFDLANNYGPPPGSAERNFGRILREDLADYRDELIVSTKAGYLMWPGPYGEWGSRKSLLASLDQSLSRYRYGLCRHFLFPPLRSEHAVGRNDESPRPRRAIRKGTLRGHFKLSA